MSEIPAIDITELEEQMSYGVEVLDVRNFGEYETARIPDVIHIPFEELEARHSELDMEASYCVVCAKGGRSAKAVEFLVANGYNAINVEGGTDAWLELGKPHQSG